jgi:hypothetical protein
MEPFVFVLAWLAYVAIFWLTVFWLDGGQEGSPGNWLNRIREILTVSLRARP